MSFLNTRTYHGTHTIQFNINTQLKFKSYVFKISLNDVKNYKIFQLNYNKQNRYKKTYIYIYIYIFMDTLYVRIKSNYISKSFLIKIILQFMS